MARDNRIVAVRLPGAIIVGAPRSGTTTMFAALRAHPDIFAAEGKELHFFDQHWEEGLAWYARHFERALPGQTAVEATPMYLSNPLAMSRISSVCPEAVLVAILRDPVDRMHSHFYYRRARGLDSGSIDDAVKREIDGRADAFPYLGIGQYARQLRQAGELGLRHPVQVLWYDDLASRSTEISYQLASALRISPKGLRIGDGRINSADSFRSVRMRRLAKRLPVLLGAAVAKVNRREVAYPPLADTTRRAAIEFLQDDVESLAALTGRDLNSWLGPPSVSS